MLKVFLIGFMCVALTHQSLIDEAQKAPKKALDQAKSLTGQQRSVRSLPEDLSEKAQDLTRQKRQFEMFGDMMSE